MSITRIIDLASFIASLGYAAFLPILLWSHNPIVAIGASSTCLIAAQSMWKQFRGAR